LNDLNDTDLDFTLSEEQQRLMERHALLNAINVLACQVHTIELAHPDANLEGIYRPIDAIASLIRKEEDNRVLNGQMQALCQGIRVAVRRLGLGIHGLGARTAVITLILRYVERLLSAPKPAGQVSALHDGRDLLASLREFLTMTQRLSCDKWQWASPGQKRSANTYTIDLNIPIGSFKAPIGLPDTCRDLLANARKFTEPGGQIGMTVKHHEDMVTVDCWDTGCGIPTDCLETCILPGGRNDPNRPNGSGLGLTKAYLLTKAHGGRFQIASKPGQGTRIRLLLPHTPVEVKRGESSFVSLGR
jgi:signal transduction histidine kinase